MKFQDSVYDPSSSEQPSTEPEPEIVIPVPNMEDLLVEISKSISEFGVFFSHQLFFFVEEIDDFIHLEEPNYEEVQHIMKDFNSDVKCRSMHFQWTEWRSATNPSDFDGNDYETLNLHRLQNASVCENPVDIEAREIENTAYYGFDWIGSSNILIHDSNLTNTKTCGNSPTWSYGISKDFGLVILKRSI